MEWSVVLLSQGIESTILPPGLPAEGPAQAGEGHGWRLAVDGRDYERAVAILRQYCQENRGQPWVQKLPWSGLVYDWRALVWIGLWIAIFWLGTAGRGMLVDAGIMDSRSVRAGEWWRLFTATMLHKDVAHLAANATTGLVLLGLAMGSFGAGFGLLASYLAGAGANLAGLVIYHDRFRGLGASGVVMAALGMLSAQSVAMWRHGVSGRQMVVRAALGGCLLLVLLGLSPETDVVAHVAGFLLGACLGALLSWLPETWRQRPWLDRLAELAFGALVLLTWALALRK